MIEIVMTAKAMGIYTVVADRDTTSPAKRFADAAWDISTDKVDELYELCIAESVDGIFCGFEDFNIHIARKLCTMLGLPFYATEEQLLTVTNKHRFKDACRKYGVPVVEQYTFADAMRLCKYPYIVKPVDSYGSRGITVCSNERELTEAYERACSVSRTSGAIIERFIDSDHGIELFYTAVNGKLYLTVTADRYTAKNGRTTVPLPVAEVFPSVISDKIHSELDGTVRNMLTSMGIENGLVLIQALYFDDEFFVYEMAYRLTGEQHYRMVERQQGINLSKLMIKLSLGEDISEFDTELLTEKYFTKPSINYALLLNEGTIKEIKGLERVFKIDEVISYNLTHKESDIIAPSGDYSHMLIRINMVADTYAALCRAVSDVNSFVKVTSTCGEDMLTVRFVLPEKETL